MLGDEYNQNWLPDTFHGQVRNQVFQSKSAMIMNKKALTDISLVWTGSEKPGFSMQL
jgi:hypothetical protein